MIEVKVLGTGCAKCDKLHDRVARVIADGGLQVELRKVKSLEEIMSYGVMLTPALVVDGEVKSVGKLPSQAQIAAWLAAAG